MVKVVSLFLIGMLVLAMFGKLRMPRLPKIRRNKTVQATRKCKKCGAYSVDGKTCQCRPK